MSPPSALLSCFHLCFPRVSGDEPKVVLVSEGSQEFSPRERG